jgi:hypothetical protein
MMNSLSRIDYFDFDIFFIQCEMMMMMSINASIMMKMNKNFTSRFNNAGSDYRLLNLIGR